MASVVAATSAGSKRPKVNHDNIYTRAGVTRITKSGGIRSISPGATEFMNLVLNCSGEKILERCVEKVYKSKKTTLKAKHLKKVLDEMGIEVRRFPLIKRVRPKAATPSAKADAAPKKVKKAAKESS